MISNAQSYDNSAAATEAFRAAEKARQLAGQVERAVESPDKLAAHAEEKAESALEKAQEARLMAARGDSVRADQAAKEASRQALEAKLEGKAATVGMRCVPERMST